MTLSEEIKKIEEFINNKDYSQISEQGLIDVLIDYGKIKKLNKKLQEIVDHYGSSANWTSTPQFAHRKDWYCGSDGNGYDFAKSLDKIENNE